MVKVGLVGLGGMGTVHYMNYKQMDDAKVVAAVGKSDSAKKKAEEWNIPLYKTITEMCEREDIDVVDICSPTFAHKDNVVEAFNNNTNVICEKPLTLSRKDAEEMFDLAKEKGKHLYVAHVVQFMKETDVLHKLVEEETFGKPLDAVFKRLTAMPNWGSDSWMFDKKKAGLIPFDLHIHDLDLIVSLFGRPREFSFQETKGTLSFPEHYRFMYTYDHLNVIGEAAWFNAKIPFMAEWAVYFEEAYVINANEQLIAYPSQGDPIIYDVVETNKTETGINVPPTEMYLNQLKHFVECIKDDVDSSKVTREQVLITLDILESISSLT